MVIYRVYRVYRVERVERVYKVYRVSGLAFMPRVLGSAMDLGQPVEGFRPSAPRRMRVTCKRHREGFRVWGLGFRVYSLGESGFACCAFRRVSTLTPKAPPQQELAFRDISVVLSGE